MRKIVVLIAAMVVMISCSSTKSEYKSVDQRNVPERYLKDFVKHHPDIKTVNWMMKPDSTEYLANYKSAANECIMKFTKNTTGTYYVVPNEYIPSDITDYVAANYKDYKLKKAFITDVRNVKSYEIQIANKQEVKKLQFDLKGNFNKVID